MAMISASLPGSLSLTLVLDGLTWESLNADIVTQLGFRTGVPRVMSVNRNKTRTLSGTLKVLGSDMDDAIAQVAAIRRLVTQGTTLTLQSRDGSTAVTVNVLAGSDVNDNFDSYILGAVAAGVEVMAPFSFVCEPYTYSAEQTVINAAAITAPCIVDTSDVVGDYPTPLYVQLNGASMHAVYVFVVRDPAADIDTFLREAEALTWAGGTASSVSNPGVSHDDYHEQNTAVDTPSEAEVDDSGLTTGTHLLLDRLYMLPSSINVHYVEGPNGEVIDNQTIYADDGSGWQLRQFGRAHLPSRNVLSGGDTHHVLGMYPRLVGYPYAVLDYHCMCPIDVGWAYYHPAVGSTVCTDLVFDYDGTVYAEYEDAGADGHPGGLYAQPGDRLLIVAHGAVGSTSPTLSLDCTVKAIPRFALWRS